MAFCPQNLRIVACAGNFTLWHYKACDKHNEIIKTDYFKNACCLKTGDMMIIENKNNEQEVAIKLYAISQNKPISLMQ